MGRSDAVGADAAGLVPPEGSTAEQYKAWFLRMRMSVPALVALCPFVDPTCEAGGVTFTLLGCYASY